jgi:hypothetical protein
VGYVKGGECSYCGFGKVSLYAIDYTPLLVEVDIFAVVHYRVVKLYINELT